MRRAYSDHVKPALVEYRMQAGADAKALNKSGESALDWALQRGETQTTKLLRAAG